jgi:PAS domain S-box-containing protein
MDITELKNSQMQLEESERKYRELVEDINDVIYSVDSKGNIIYISPAVKSLFGYEPHKIIGKHFSDLVYSEDLPAMKEGFEASLKDQNTPMDYRIVKKDGSHAWVSAFSKAIYDDGNNVIGLRGVVSDITERKRMEEELKKSEHDKSLILNSTSEIIGFHDLDHNIQWVNKAYLKATRLSLSQVQGRKCYHVWGLDRLCKDCPVSKAIETGESHEGELTPQNQEHWPADQGSWMVRAAPVKNDDGSIVGAIEVAYDITKRKKVEEQMNQMRSELLHATRAGTMGELTAALAHELNHPLGSILNNANAARRYLEQDDPDLDEIRDIIDDIISEDRRANEVMQKVRNLMKKTEVGLTRVQINDIIEEVVKLTRSEFLIENVNLSTELRENLPEVAGERIQLQQVFINLTMNAIDAMKETKTKMLHISTARHDADYIRICISDTGKGFGDEEKAGLFKPFFTTKEEGMGMGLSVTRTIIKSHGGDIGAENNKEAGASFFITLPVYKEGSRE